MAKLYWTKDIKNLIDKKLKDDGAELVNDPDIPELELAHFVHELRVFKKYAYELIEEMEQLDREDDEEMARWTAERAAREQEEKEPYDDK